MSSPGRSKALVVAISGCSSSGKTTLARLLRDIFPLSFILHQDDFYKPESELPCTNGLLDWDCAEAIDFDAMADALSYIRQHAALPPRLVSKEDQNAVGDCPVSNDTLTALKNRVTTFLSTAPPSQTSLSLCFVDGFLLFTPSIAPILDPCLDLRLFVRASHARAKSRREARLGYVTIEGFWQDPPGYVDSVVWPNYVANHAWMFEDGRVEGRFNDRALQEAGIRVLPDSPVDADMTALLSWMVDMILTELQKHGE